jgi:hypothetical protein
MQDSKFIPALFISLALILSAAVFGGFYYSAQSVNSTDALSVTGSAKVHVTSDQAKLTVVFSRTASISDLASGYRGMDSDLKAVRGLLKKEGIEDTAVTENPVTMYKSYNPDYNAESRYEINQNVIISSPDINKVTEISKKIPSLSEGGAAISVQSLEYFYSKLPDLRVSLLSDAVTDAKARAEKIAEGSGRKVGNVQSASSGVVQVLAPNSIDVADYGNYDTSSIEKEVMVTVKASFRLL